MAAALQSGRRQQAGRSGGRERRRVRCRAGARLWVLGLALGLAAAAGSTATPGGATAAPVGTVKDVANDAFKAAPPAALRAALGAALNAELDAELDAAITTHGYLGAQGLVIVAGQTVWQRTAGHRDLARQVPLTEDTVFRIYSMTKPMASVLALQLVADGRLGLDDPVARHLPAFAGLGVWAGTPGGAPGGATIPAGQAAPAQPPARAMTVRHLLTHTAGFATGGAGIEAASALLQAAAPEDAPTLAAYAERVASVPLAADPGARFRYDGVNTEVLARVLEVAAGQDFESLLQQRLLQPLGLHDTGLQVAPAQRHRIATLTRVAADGTLQAQPEPGSRQPGGRLRAYASAAGGLYATARDFGRFCRMLAEGGTLDGVTVLGTERIEQMMSNQLQQDDPAPGLTADTFRPGEGFGLGGAVVLGRPGAGPALPAGSFGWSGAASTYFSVHRPQRLCAVLLLQHLPGDTAHERPRLQHRFFQRVHQAMAQVPGLSRVSSASASAHPHPPQAVHPLPTGEPAR